jgi:hypothetical protein
MSKPRRIPTVAALAACLSALAFVSACTEEEDPTYLPIAGAWTYQQLSVVSNSCPADVTPAPLTTFLLDYDSGNTFEIELGVEDVTCKIVGPNFDCGNLTLFHDSEEFEIRIRWVYTWEGEMLSESEIEGNERISVSCTGDECELLEEVLPCAINRTFVANAI